MPQTLKSFYQRVDVARAIPTNSFLMNPFRKRPAAGYLPAVLLLSTILLLTLILASLGQRTIKREKTLLLDLKGRQAEFVIKSLASASRISVLMLDPSSRHLQRFVNDTADTENVQFIAVYNAQGRLIAKSRRFSQNLYGLTVAEIKARIGKENRAFYIEDYPDVGKIYVLAGRFYPFDSSWMHLRMLGIPSIPGVTEDQEETGDDTGAFYALVGMDMGDLDEAVRKGTRQTVLNGLLLLLLGTVGFYFLILVQGYYSAKRALADVRQYTLDVIEGMAEGLVNIDQAGILRNVNPEAEHMLGESNRELVGKHWNDAFDGEEWQPVKKCLSRGMPFYDLEIPPGGSQRQHLVVTMIPVRGQAGGMVLFLRDMGEVRSLQTEVRRSERLAALGRMVAGMAHEIRNPLNSIRGFSQHLKNRFTPESVEMRSVDTIIREVDRLNRVITELLDFSKPREPDLAEIDLNEIVKSTISLVEREAASQGIMCVDETNPEPVHIMGDGDSLKQLLLNLLLNAIQAMPEGGVLTAATAVSGDKAVLSISDTGMGISEKDQERIFEPFFTSRETGTGLGLSTVHRIAQDHNAEIRVKSSEGEGTKFTVRFSLAKTP